MLSRFSDYLKKTNTNHTSLYSLQSIARVWFDKLLNAFEILANHYPGKTWEILDIFPKNNSNYVAKRQGLSTWEKLFEIYHQTGNTPESFIIQMDAYYSHIINNINMAFLKKFQNNPYYGGAGFFPFIRQAGVEMICRLRKNDGSIVFETKSGHSSIGASKQDKRNIRAAITDIKRSGGLAYLDAALKKVTNKQFLELIDSRDPHAEDHFFIDYLTGLIEKLNEIRNEVQNDVSSDTCQASLLVGSRIEFIMSTSPCVDCQPYFRALKQLLNDMDIRLPILIFAKSAYNLEESFSIFSISYDTTYETLPFQWSKEGKTLIIENPGILSTKSLPPEYRAILVLNAFGSALLPRLIATPLVINSFFSSLLESHGLDNEVITSYIFLDWLKFYFVEVLRSLPYDFKSTSIEEIMSPDSYTQIELPFIKESFFEFSHIEDYQKLIRYAHKGDNALIFFLKLFPKWGETIYKLLQNEESLEITMLPPNIELDTFVKNIFDHLYWQVETAPPDLQSEVDNFREEKV